MKMFFLLYVIGALAVSVTGGPEEVDMAYPLEGVTELTSSYFTKLSSDGDIIEAVAGEDEGEEEEEVERDEEEEEVTRNDADKDDDDGDDDDDDDEEKPYFDASMLPTYTAYLGKTATLTCIVHAAKSDKSVSWIRGRDLRILTVGKYTYTTDLRFEALHQEGSSEWTLRIKSVQERDQGNYECQITTKPISTFNVYLKVVEPTVEILGAPDIYVNRASMINLTCVVHHAPYPPESITWFHQNKTIGYTSPRGGVSVVEERGETTTSFLLLQNARASDTGVFTCQPEKMQAAVATLHVLDGEKPAAIATNSSSPSCRSQVSTLWLVILIATSCVMM